MANELEHGLGDYLLAAQAERIRELEAALADRLRDESSYLCDEAADAIDGLMNLRAILEDQPYENSPLTVIEVRTILENKGGFMPDEAVVWFRGWRGGEYA